jgi:MarR family transcriptional regulator, transcriptional regulator for hemolysin
MPTSVDSDVLVLLYDVARHMRTYADQMARAHGMTRAQWVILARLERQPDLSQNELAALAEVTPMTIARLIDRLEALGEIKQMRAKLHAVMTKGIDPAVLDTMGVGLRQMKENVSSQRLAEAAA